MLKKLLLVLLLFSTMSFANEIENLPEDKDVIVKAKTLQIVTYVIEQQKESILELNMRVYKLNKELQKLRSKCTI